MFNTKNESGEDTNIHHIAEMVALLGVPPADFVDQSKFAERYFDTQGEPRTSDRSHHLIHYQGKYIGKAKMSLTSLEDSEENLQGEDKRLFLEFMRKMLQWKPEARLSAAELLKDPWLEGQ